MKNLFLLLLCIGLPAIALGNNQPSLFTRAAGYWTSQADEAKTNFFGRLTDGKSQRENWYAVSPYIAEFNCAISNAGFFYVAWKHQSPQVFFAGLASLVSHTVPKKWIHSIDLVGVAATFSLAITHRKAIQENPRYLWFGVAAAALNWFDMYMARTKGVTWPHVMWHLGAAALVDQFLNSVKQHNTGK